MNANKQGAGGLPPLPEPVEIYCDRWADYGYGYTSGQMLAYGEQCRAASGDAGRLASKLEDVREGIADVLPIVYLETIDDAIEALRALSRGVPEGNKPYQSGIGISWRLDHETRMPKCRQAEDGTPIPVFDYEVRKHWEVTLRIITEGEPPSADDVIAAIAAQRKEGQ